MKVFPSLIRHCSKVPRKIRSDVNQENGFSVISVSPLLNKKNFRGHLIQFLNSCDLLLPRKFSEIPLKVSLPLRSLSSRVLMKLSLCRSFYNGPNNTHFFSFTSLIFWNLALTYSKPSEPFLANIFTYYFLSKALWR